jgi:hypothetical protein
MGKKKDKDKSFTNALDDNKKKINVQPIGWTEPKTLAEAIDDSVEKTTSCSINAMIPVSVTESAENQPDLPYLAITTCYTDSIYSLYELGFKSQGVKQTLVVPLLRDSADDIFEDERLDAVIRALSRNTNIALVIDELPKKTWKKLKEWANDDDGGNMFVIRIPNLLMFHENVKKNEVTTPSLFDVLITVSNVSSKSLKKAKKSSDEAIDDWTKAFTTDVVSIFDNFGVGSAHVPLWKEFFRDPYVAAHKWAASLTEGKHSCLKRLTFSTTEPTLLTSFNGEMTRILNGDEGNGMRVI